jgi:NADPH:quinone reductase-like Zn-dependent oxidoreductase
MKAAVMHEFGDFDVLKYEDITTPEPKSGHVLVKVLAAGVNRLDHYLREGSVTRDIPLPHILGADAVGEVAELGPGVSGLKAGDKVIVVPGFPLKEAEKDIYPAVTAPSFALPGLGIWGGYAQYIEVPARSVVKDETGLAPERLATLPVVLTTAVRSVKKVARVEAGDKVLVQAGASGSGSMLIQVAKALGAEVATTVRGAAKAEFVESLGVDLVIDTRKADFVERIKEWTGEKQLKGSMASDVADLEWGLEQLRAGRIEAVLDRALPLSDAAQAHRLIAANQVKGNIVLLPWAA